MQFLQPSSPVVIATFHVFMAVALAYVFDLDASGVKRVWLHRLIALIGAGLSLSIAVLYQLEIPRLERRLEMIDPVYPVDLFMHIAGVLLILDASRRAVGMSLVTVVAAFLFYAYFGNIFPGWLAFPGFSVQSQAELISMQTSGIFGVTASAAINFVFYFVLFGTVFSATGGGALFIDIAMRATAGLAAAPQKCRL